MQAIQTFKLATAAVLVAASFQVWAQDASAPPVAASGTAVTAKQLAKAARAADRVLAHKVRATLSKDKNLDVTHVNVHAKDGIVTLEGTFPEQSQIDHAIAVTKGIAGVNSVVDAMAVRPAGS
ncbi:BON domain-containing protein [Paraburkholderia acidipaludis]|uniref:BON domain-containing protein n=1 Tax=Paraburkholderia acidipaludis TaxID=660537 RepID=UPI000487BEF6|nr:BON domain-containing protein [Paraburkholderia acidipaludis]